MHKNATYTRTGTADQTAVPVNCLMATRSFERAVIILLSFLLYAVPLYRREQFFHGCRESADAGHTQRKRVKSGGEQRCAS